MAVDDDPGWKLDIRTVVTAALPGFQALQQHRARSGKADVLLAIRRVFVSVCVALVLISVTLLVFVDPGGQPPGGNDLDVAPVVVGLTVLGAAAQVVPRVIRRPFDCSSDAALAVRYRTTFFLGLAFAETPALLGFVGSFLTRTTWMYLVGLPWTIVGLVTIAPTRGRIQRDQDELRLSGCGRSLIAALRGPAAQPQPPPPSPRDRIV